MSTRFAGARSAPRPRARGTALSLLASTPERDVEAALPEPATTSTPRSKGVPFSLPIRTPEPEAELVASSSQSQTTSSQKEQSNGVSKGSARSKGTAFAIPSELPEPSAEPETAAQARQDKGHGQQNVASSSATPARTANAARAASSTSTQARLQASMGPPSRPAASRVTPGPSRDNGRQSSAPRAASILRSPRSATPTARSLAVAGQKRIAMSPAPPPVTSGRDPSAGPSSGARARPPGRRLSIASARSESDRPRAPSSSGVATSSRLSRGPRGRPAKPPTPFALFREQIRPAVADEAATALGARFDITAEVKSRWTALAETDRVPYEEEAARRRVIYESAMEEWLKQHPESITHEDTSNKKQKIAPGDGPDLSELPQPPVKPIDMYAFDIIADTPEATSTDVMARWKVLNSADKTAYIQRGVIARQEYTQAYAAWKEAHPHDAEIYEARKAKAKAKKAPRQTISDDEAEYLVEIMQHGRELRSKRLDPSSISMSEISGVKYERGRASERTFHTARLLRNLKHQAQARNRFERQHGYPMPAEMQQAMQAPARGSNNAREASAGATSTAASDGEDNATSGGEQTGGETDDDQSDAESVGATSTASTAVPLRERRFAIRTRIVNGQIVLDESSLQQNRNDETAYGQGGEAIDINESDRFVNSATHAKPRMRSERWTDLESRRFLEAVSMWGSDFEMIARMFPRRDRKQIRARWRAMEKLDPRSLDLAFRRKLPVDLDAYGVLAGVDLSGEAAPIEAKNMLELKGDDEADDGEASGNEHIKKSPGPPTPAPNEEDEAQEQDDDEQLPDFDVAMAEDQLRRAAEASAAEPEEREQRGVSVVSTGSQGPPQIMAASGKGKGRAADAPAARRGRSAVISAQPGEAAHDQAQTNHAAMATEDDDHASARQLRPTRSSRRR